MKREELESIIEAKEVIRGLITLMTATENSKRFEVYHDSVVEEVEKLYQFVGQIRFNGKEET